MYDGLFFKKWEKTEAKELEKGLYSSEKWKLL
jgi:hypothetical protein